MRVEIYVGKQLKPYLVTTANALNVHVGEWVTVSKNNKRKMKGGIIDKIIHLIDEDEVYTIRIFLK